MAFVAPITPASVAAGDRSSFAIAVAAVLQSAGAEDDLASQISEMGSTTGGALRLASYLRHPELPEEIRCTIVRVMSAQTQPEIRDLFEMYLPLGERRQRLGPRVDESAILRLTGNAARGHKIYWHTAGLQCQTCHRIAGHGGTVGPDLSSVGKKHERPILLETLVKPSAKIDREYQTHTLITAEGRIYSGRILQKNQNVVLQTADDKQVKVSAADVAQLAPSDKSLMPDQLLQSLTAQEAADLVEYLMSLR